MENMEDKLLAIKFKPTTLRKASLEIKYLIWNVEGQFIYNNL